MGHKVLSMPFYERFYFEREFPKDCFEFFPVKKPKQHYFIRHFWRTEEVTKIIQELEQDSMVNSDSTDSLSSIASNQYSDTDSKSPLKTKPQKSPKNKPLIEKFKRLIIDLLQNVVLIADKRPYHKLLFKDECLDQLLESFNYLYPDHPALNTLKTILKNPDMPLEFSLEAGTKDHPQLLYSTTPPERYHPQFQSFIKRVDQVDKFFKAMPELDRETVLKLQLYTLTHLHPNAPFNLKEAARLNLQVNPLLALTNQSNPYIRTGFIWEWANSYLKTIVQERFNATSFFSFPGSDPETALKHLFKTATSTTEPTIASGSGAAASASPGVPSLQNTHQIVKFSEFFNLCTAPLSRLIRRSETETFTMGKHWVQHLFKPDHIKHWLSEIISNTTLLITNDDAPDKVNIETLFLEKLYPKVVSFLKDNVATFRESCEKFDTYESQFKNVFTKKLKQAVNHLNKTNQLHLCKIWNPNPETQVQVVVEYGKSKFKDLPQKMANAGLNPTPASMYEFLLRQPGHHYDDMVSKFRSPDTGGCIETKEDEPQISVSIAPFLTRKNPDDIFEKTIEKLIIHLDATSPLDAITKAPLKEFIANQYQEALTLFSQADDTLSRYTHFQRFLEVVNLHLSITNSRSIDGLQSDFNSILSKKFRDAHDSTLTSAHLCPFGMTGHGRVFDAAKKLHYDTILTLKSSYYELHAHLNTAKADHQTVMIETELKETYDIPPNIIFTDFHVNHATSKESIWKIPVIEWLPNYLENNEGSLTLVLDITINLLTDDDLKIFCNIAKPYVEKGQLNVVFVQSLAKFTQMGADILPGGGLYVWNRPEYWSKFNSIIEKQESENPTTQSQYHYFSLLMAQCEDLQKEYMEEISDNVTTFLHKIDLHFSNSPCLDVTLCTDTKNPIIAYTLEPFFSKIGMSDAEEQERAAQLIYQFIQYLIHLFNLPMNQRASFGFPISNFALCSSNFRLTLGIENVTHLLNYHLLMSFINELLKSAKDMDHLKKLFKDFKQFGVRHKEGVESDIDADPHLKEEVDLLIHSPSKIDSKRLLIGPLAKDLIVFIAHLYPDPIQREAFFQNIRFHIDMSDRITYDPLTKTQNYHPVVS